VGVEEEAVEEEGVVEGVEEGPQEWIEAVGGDKVCVVHPEEIGK